MGAVLLDETGDRVETCNSGGFSLCGDLLPCNGECNVICVISGRDGVACKGVSGIGQLSLNGAVDDCEGESVDNVESGVVWVETEDAPMKDSFGLPPSWDRVDVLVGNANSCDVRHVRSSVVVVTAPSPPYFIHAWTNASNRTTGTSILSTFFEFSRDL